MTLQRVAATASTIDVLDHVLDKGIVIDAWLRVAVAGIDLVTVEARVVVASIRTYRARATALSRVGPAASFSGVATATGGRLDAQLRQLRDQIEHRRLEPQARRRLEDRVRDELHDRRARTLKGQ
jgi:hypothetical protein